MIDLEQLKRDREAGTPGPWRLGSWGDNVFGAGPKGEWLAVCRVKRDDATLDESLDAIDARRIARVPDLEAMVLEQADEITRLRADLAAAREQVAGEHGAAAQVWAKAIAAALKPYDDCLITPDNDRDEWWCDGLTYYFHEINALVNPYYGETEISALEAIKSQVEAETRAKVIAEAKAAINDYPRVAPDATEAQHYDEQIEYAERCLDALHTPESRAAQSSEGAE